MVQIQQVVQELLGQDGALRARGGKGRPREMVQHTIESLRLWHGETNHKDIFYKFHFKYEWQIQSILRAISVLFF